MNEKTLPGCPFIDRDIVPGVNNTPVTYRTQDGKEYIFYRHDDGFGKKRNCQFCSLIGRVYDVFKCLNEVEYTDCSRYKHNIK